MKQEEEEKQSTLHVQRMKRWRDEDDDEEGWCWKWRDKELVSLYFVLLFPFDSSCTSVCYLSGNNCCARVSLVIKVRAKERERNETNFSLKRVTSLVERNNTVPSFLPLLLLSPHLFSCRLKTSSSTSFCGTKGKKEHDAQGKRQNMTKYNIPLFHTFFSLSLLPSNDCLSFLSFLRRFQSQSNNDLLLWFSLLFLSSSDSLFKNHVTMTWATFEPCLPTTLALQEYVKITNSLLFKYSA